MANRYLIDININDTLPDVIRKTNHNFRAMTGSQTKMSNSRIRNESSDLQDEVDRKANASDLSAVAYSGEYSDILNAPDPVDPDNFAEVAFSGDYDDLINKPTITEPVYGSNPPVSSTVVIAGDNSFDDLGMKHLANTEIQDIINLVDSTT